MRKLIIAALVALILAPVMRAQITPLTVTITAGPGDTKQGCTVTYTASASGGCPGYTYRWSASTGSGGTWTGSTITANASVLGTGTMSVTATDSKQPTASTATASRSYNIHKEYETTGPTTGGTASFGTAKAVSASATCPADSPGNCSITFITNTTASASIGLTVTGGADIGPIKASVAGTTTSTITSQTGQSYTFPIAPNETKAIYARPAILTRTGTWKKYDCSGLNSEGNWTNVDKQNPDWNYTAMTPS